MHMYGMYYNTTCLNIQSLVSEPEFSDRAEPRKKHSDFGLSILSWLAW